MIHAVWRRSSRVPRSAGTMVKISRRRSPGCIPNAPLGGPRHDPSASMRACHRWRLHDSRQDHIFIDSCQGFSGKVFMTRSIHLIPPYTLHTGAFQWRTISCAIATGLAKKTEILPLPGRNGRNILNHTRNPKNGTLYRFRLLNNRKLPIDAVGNYAGGLVRNRTFPRMFRRQADSSCPWAAGFPLPTICGDRSPAMPNSSCSS